VHHRQGRGLGRLLVRAFVLEQGAAHDILDGVAVPEGGATAAAADHLVAVPDGEERFVPQIGGERNSV